MNEEELIRETRKLIGRWDNIRIVGQGWAGDTRRGFQFNPIRTTSPEGTTPVTPSGACCPPSGDCFISTQAVCEGGGGTYQGNNTTCVPDPCTPDTGACCVGSDCSIESESDCTDMGGIFQGVDTTCSPNPCPQPTGACCVGTDCSIETESDCTGMGGTYQGDDTICDPNPCETPPCAGCGFINPDDGLTYLTKTYHYSIDNSNCPSTPTVNCIGPSGAPCHPVYFCGQNPCICPAIILGGTRFESVIAEEHYIAGTCEYNFSNENIQLELSCACQIFTNDCLTGGGDPGSENCAIDTPDCRTANGCPDDCSGVTPPFGDCSVVTITVTYSNQCIP